MDKDSRIYVAGHTGLAGSAIVRRLKEKGYENIIYETHQDLDLTDPKMVNWYFSSHLPGYVFLAAARVGGVLESMTHPTELLSDNLLIQTNVINTCHRYKVKRLLFLGSSCIYPVNGHQPYKEEQLGAGKTDENWSYAIAKLAGIELCRSYFRQYGCNFLSIIPCNLIGPQKISNFENAHVVPALIDKLHKGKISNQDSIEVWGDGTAKREFIDADDFADASVMLIENSHYGYLCDGVINIGTGKDISIMDLVIIIREIVDYKGQIQFNPDLLPGVKTKLMDISRMRKLGFETKIDLYKSIKKTYEGYLQYAKN